MGEGALCTVSATLRLLGIVGVEPRPLAAVDSRFFSVSRFSRCSRSRGGGFAFARGAMSGFKGEEIAGTWACMCSGAIWGGIATGVSAGACTGADAGSVAWAGSGGGGGVVVEGG